MANDPLLAGIDVGTTNIKTVIFDPTGHTVAQASTPTPIHYPQPAWAYYNPQELWEATVSVLRQATGQLDNPNRIVSIAVASAGEAGIPLDAQGQPTYDAIAWFDQRTQPQTEWLAKTIGKERLFETSGLSLQPIFSLCKLLWIKENEPNAYARAVRWLHLADYIAWCLSGVPATDFSLASRTLALDLRKQKWRTDLIQEVGIEPDIFAPLTQSGTVLGQVTPEASEATGLPTTVKVAAGGHDHVCGALALGVTKPGVMLNSMGTAEALFIPLDQPLTNPQMGRQGYTQGAHVVADKYYLLCAVYTSGACVDWLREITGESQDFATLTNEARQVPATSLGVGFLPHLRLANPPHDDPRGRGAFIGLSTDAKRGVLFRAMLEGLAYEARYALEGGLAYPGVEPLETIYLTGGSTRNRLLTQIRAAIFNQPLTIVEVAEATSLGAAVLGGLGAGVYDNLESVLKALDYSQTVIKPDVDQIDAYETYYQQVYRKLYLTLSELHHNIYKLSHKQNEVS